MSFSCSPDEVLSVFLDWEVTGAGNRRHTDSKRLFRQFFAAGGAAVLSVATVSLGSGGRAERHFPAWERLSPVHTAAARCATSSEGLRAACAGSAPSSDGGHPCRPAVRPSPDTGFGGHLTGQCGIRTGVAVISVSCVWFGSAAAGVAAIGHRRSSCPRRPPPPPPSCGPKYPPRRRLAADHRRDTRGSPGRPVQRVDRIDSDEMEHTEYRPLPTPGASSATRLPA